MDIIGPQCDDIHRPNVTDQCFFVKTTGSCDTENGFFNYTDFLYCCLAGVPIWVGCILLIIWLLFMFSGLAVTANDFFCPSLAIISKSLRLSDNVAGVTFLAFGNGAPDLFSAIAAIQSAQAGDAGMAIGALFGAGVFVTAVVAGSISIIKPFHVMQRPLLRDVIFYLTATFTCWKIMWDKYITQWEAAALLGLYALYVVVVIVGRSVNQMLKKRKAHAGYARLEGDDNEKLDHEKTEVDQGKQEAPAAIVTAGGSRNSLDENNSNATSYKSIDTNINLSSGISRDSPYNNIITDGQDFPTTTTGAGIDVMKNEDGIAFVHPNSQKIADNTLKPKSSEQTIHPKGGTVALLLLFLRGINPIDTDGWSEMAVFRKIFEVFKCPILLCLKLTVPVVNDENHDGHASNTEEEKQILLSNEHDERKMEENEDAEEEGTSYLRNWNRPLNSFQIFIGPTFSSLVTGVGLYTIGPVPVYALVIVLFAVLALAVFLLTKTNRRPKYHVLFSYLGFVIAVIWIYCIANEIVNILKTLGVVFRLSNAILGLTFLAWGNCVGDMVADLSMTRQGYPKMAISACFGSPIFTMLIGLGVAFSLACAERGGVFELQVSLLEMLLAGGLALSLISTLVIVPISGFFMSRSYGVYLIILYIVFLLVVILTETNVITNFEI